MNDKESFPVSFLMNTEYRDDDGDVYNAEIYTIGPTDGPTNNWLVKYTDKKGEEKMVLLGNVIPTAIK